MLTPFLTTKWLRLAPVLVLVIVIIHLGTSEYRSSGYVVPEFASEYLPDRLPWSPKPEAPHQNPIPIEHAFANENELLGSVPTAPHTPTGQEASDISSNDAYDGSHRGVPNSDISGINPGSPAALNGQASQAPMINHTAHRYRDPDQFKDHFKAVLSLPGLPIADAKATCDWGPNVKPNFMSHEATDWVQNDVSDFEIASARQGWYDFIQSGLVPWSESKKNFSGRGIVIVGGQMNSLKRIRLQLKLLKAYGSRVPVEIHYWDTELNATMGAELKKLYRYTSIRDLSTLGGPNILKTFGPFMNGYHMKTNAVINSGFAEVLLLDSDNVPMHDPAPLFESKTYKEYGTVFWPDIARTRPNNPMWPVTNTLCRMNEYEQESGQMLVDKRRFFYHLQLSSYFMATDFYRRYVLGDKDMFRFAWHALKTTYGQPGRWIATLGTRLPEPNPFFCGRSFAQHHPDEGNGAISFLHLNAMKLMAPEVFNFFKSRGGVFQYYKGPPHPSDWEDVVPAGLKSEDTKFLLAEPSRASACLDFYNEPAIKTESILPDFDKFFRDLGGYEVLQDSVGG